MSAWTLRILDIGNRPVPHVDMIAEHRRGRRQWISVSELPNGRLRFMIPFDMPWHVKRKAINSARTIGLGKPRRRT